MLMLVFTLEWISRALLLLDLAIVPSGPRLVIALQAITAPGQPATPLRTDCGDKLVGQIQTKARPMLAPKAKAKAKAKVQMVTSKSAGDPLQKKMAGLLHLQPRSEESPLLATPIGLLALDGLRAPALTKSAIIGIPLSAKTLRQAIARKEPSANSCI